LPIPTESIDQKTNISSTKQNQKTHKNKNQQGFLAPAVNNYLQKVGFMRLWIAQGLTFFFLVS
jgi:hypothetical protein